MTRDLWNCIAICGQQYVYKRDMDKGFQHFHLCKTREHILYILERSGTTPLHLYLIPDRTLSAIMPNTASKSPNKILSLLKMVETQCPTPRLRSLNMERRFHLILPDLPDEMLNDWDFSQLESLGTWVPDLVSRAVQESNQLCSLAIPEDLLDRIQDTRLKTTLPRLEVFDGRKLVTLQALSTFQGIVNLELSVNQRESAPRVKMEQLQALNLNQTFPLWPIDCPNLVHLRITPPEWLYSHSRGDIIVLPSLKMLEYFSRGRVSLLRFFDAPNLETLRIEESLLKKQATYKALAEIWPVTNATRNPLDPRILTFSHTTVGERSLARVLCRLTRCREIHLIDTVFSGTFLDGLQPINKKTGMVVPLPMLRVVTMDCDTQRKGVCVNEGQILDAASRLRAMRQAAGSPLVQFRFAYGGLWKRLASNCSLP